MLLDVVQVIRTTQENAMNHRELAVLKIREMILQGALSAGQRVSEAMLAEQLGISRTPVRQAFPVLEQEGLLLALATRGYMVRSFSMAELVDAVELRGLMEGAAARTIAERGAPRALIRALRACLDAGDLVFAKRHLLADDENAYSEMNHEFHRLLVEASERPVLIDAVARLNRIPFISPRAIAFDRGSLERAYDLLSFAHRQHRAVVDALERGEGARAEALMREHVNPQKDSMNLAIDAAAAPVRLAV